VAIAGRVGTAILSECGKPAVRLKPVAVLARTSVVWPDLDLHVGPSRCASGERRGAAGDVSCDRRMHGVKDRVAVARPVVPRSGAADAAYPVMPGCHRQAQMAACRQRAPGLPRSTRAAVAACPPPYQAPRAHRLGFYESTVPVSNHGLIYLR